jgi:hypothetical protein
MSEQGMVARRHHKPPPRWNRPFVLAMEARIREILIEHHARGPFVPRLTVKEIAERLGRNVPVRFVGHRLNYIMGRDYRRTSF